MLAYLPYLSLFVGGWMVLNGILHDLFVLKSEASRKYDRELLRLLMDGHILITCGVMQVISFYGLRTDASWAYWVAGAACLSLLIYCAMIFPFLKSFGTIILNLLLIFLLCLKYFM